MIVKIIPIKRLPYPLNYFDYSVPEEMQSKIKEGQLVTIPFRKSSLFGLVLSIDKTNKNNTLKEVISVVNEEPFIPEKYLSYIDIWAQWYHLSPATFASLLLPPLQKRKLKKVELNKITKDKIIKKSKREYLLYANEKEHQEELVKNISGRTLLVIPEIYIAQEVYKLLPIDLQQETVIWHSQLSPKQQFDRWFSIRNEEKNIIIGTRGSILLPIPNLETIIIDQEHHREHKHWDQAPRFHTKDIALFLHKKSNVNLIQMSYSLSTEAYFNIYKNKISLNKKSVKNNETIFGNKNTEHTLVDMRNEQRAGRYNVISDQVKVALENSKEDIFIFSSRRGFASAAVCQNCNHVAKCLSCQQVLVWHDGKQKLICHLCGKEENLINICPECKESKIELRGAGTEFIESGLKSIFKDNKDISVVRIDKDIDEDEIYTETRRKVIVGTQMAMRHIRWSKTDLVVFTDIDKQLNIPEYLANEEVWHLLQTILYKKKAKSDFLIQTFDPNHLVFKSIKEPDRFYREELNGRRAFGYPPYTFMVRLFFGHESEMASKNEAKRVYDYLQKKLTIEPKKVILKMPIAMHPYQYRKKFWYIILAKVEKENTGDTIVWLNKNLPANWKVDPNPISILSP